MDLPKISNPTKQLQVCRFHSYALQMIIVGGAVASWLVRSTAD